MASSPSLIKAYQQAVYHVLMEPPVTLKVGDASDVIFESLEKQGLELVDETGIAVITADNPMSIQRTAIVTRAPFATGGGYCSHKTAGMFSN